MDKLDLSETFYSLNFEDIQTVANEEIGRDLSKDELLKLVDEISENINWYDAISDSIIQNIE